MRPVEAILLQRRSDGAPLSCMPRLDVRSWPRQIGPIVLYKPDCPVPNICSLMPLASEDKLRHERVSTLTRPGSHDMADTQVVTKLFNIVDPDLAFFGSKDYQQWRILHRLARDLDFGIQVVAVPLVREADGLAMSRCVDAIAKHSQLVGDAALPMMPTTGGTRYIHR